MEIRRVFSDDISTFYLSRMPWIILVQALGYSLLGDHTSDGDVKTFLVEKGNDCTIQYL